MDSEKRPRVRVAALVTSPEGVLLVKHQKQDHEYWLLPGGGLDYGEEIGAALAREVREETCLEVEAGRLVLVAETIAPDVSRHVVHLVLEARVTGGELGCGVDPRVTEARFLPMDELAQIELHPPLGKQLMAHLDGAVPCPGYVGKVWRD